MSVRVRACVCGDSERIGTEEEEDGYTGSMLLVGRGDCCSEDCGLIHSLFATQDVCPVNTKAGMSCLCHLNSNNEKTFCTRK